MHAGLHCVNEAHGYLVSERGHRHVHIVFEHIFVFLVWTREYIYLFNVYEAVPN